VGWSERTSTGIVAYKTVRWTQHGDARLALDAERRRAAESMTRLTHKVTNELISQMFGEKDAAASDAYGEWNVEWGVQSPLLRDLRNVDEHLQVFHDLCRDLLDAVWEVGQLEQLTRSPAVGNGRSDPSTTFGRWRTAAMGTILGASKVTLQALYAARRGEAAGTVHPYAPPALLSDADWPSSAQRL